MKDDHEEEHKSKGITEATLEERITNLQHRLDEEAVDKQNIEFSLLQQLSMLKSVLERRKVRRIMRQQIL